MITLMPLMPLTPLKKGFRIRESVQKKVRKEKKMKMNGLQLRKMVSNVGGWWPQLSIGSLKHVLALHPEAPGSILSIPKNVFRCS